VCSSDLPQGGKTLAPGERSAAYDIPALLYRLPQVTIASIDGGCAGAGLGWACACDFRFASARARFSTAFLSVGASGDMALAWSLVRLLGGARARELMFFPDKFGADDALRSGLISRIFEADDLARETLAAAGVLAARSGPALRMMKANMASAESLPLEAYIDVETSRHLQLSEALKESFAALRMSRVKAPE